MGADRVADTTAPSPDSSQPSGSLLPSCAGSSSGICRAVGLDEGKVRSLVEVLTARGWTVAVAESLTAGLVTAVLTEVPGASAVVRGGVVCYSTDLKSSLAGVAPDLLQAVGPVHPDVARSLARGVRRRCDATIGVGLTGVAGPDSQGGRPPGTVFVAVASRDGEQVSDGEIEQHDAIDVTARGSARASIRAAAVRKAISMLSAVAQRATA